MPMNSKSNEIHVVIAMDGTLTVFVDYKSGRFGIGYSVMLPALEVYGVYCFLSYRQWTCTY